MKRILSLVLFAVVSATSLFLGNNIDYTVVVEPTVTKEPEYVLKWVMNNLGIPSASSYGNDKLSSRNPWDMTVFDGKLYIGSGDYSDNTGPVAIWRYDIQNNIWENTGTVNDEAVARFHTINNNLVISGVDPKDDHDFGSYYVLNQDKWETVRNVPNGVHMFDIVEHNDEMFYAIGTANGKNSPVQKTADGKKFVNVPFYDGEKKILGDESLHHSRCYAFFKVDGRLFAFCKWYNSGAYGFYEYKKDAFRKIEDISTIKVKFPGINRQSLINEWLTVEDTCYISLGFVYTTKDFTKLEPLQVPDNQYVTDICESDGKIYMISTKKNESEPVAEGEAMPPATYKNTVWEYSKTNGFKEVFSFDHGTTAMNMCSYNGKFYIGMGSYNDPSIDQTLNGTILMFEEKLVEKTPE